MTTSRDRRVNLAGWLLMLTASLSGCGVAVPTRPDVEIERCQPSALDEASLVSLSPRVLLQKFADAISGPGNMIIFFFGRLFHFFAHLWQSCC